MIVTLTHDTNHTETFTNVMSIASTDKAISIIYKDATSPYAVTSKDYKTSNLGTYSISIQPDPAPESNT